MNRTPAPRSPAQRAPVRRALRLWLLAAVTGVASGVAAYLLLALIGLAMNLVFYGRVGFELPELTHHTLDWWVLVIPAIGGLIVGLLARYGTPQIRGHGIPEAMEAILTKESRVAPRVAIFKPLSIVVAIGTGGPFGAEGPIIQSGGALGSLLGQWLRGTTAAERKVLLACGAAGGMAAVFGTPVAAVVLSIELLLFEYRTRSLVPLAISAVLATSVRQLLLGSGPLFDLAEVDFGMPGQIPWYVLFGVLCGGLSVLISRFLFRIEDWFDDLPIGDIWRPALGGLGLGLIGFFFPRVLGVGYGTIESLLNDNLAVTVVASVFVFKLAAMLVSLGSGTSGGLLAPLFMVGAAFGTLFADAVDTLGFVQLDPRAYAVTGMAALFGAAARAPFALVIFAFEITRDYEAILPLMLVGVISAGVVEFLMQDTIMTEKLSRRGIRVPQGYEVDPLSTVNAAQAMKPAHREFGVDTPLRDVARFLLAERRLRHPRPFAPVVDSDERLIGLATYTDILGALQGEENSDQLTIGDIASRELVFCRPDQSLREAAELMMIHEISHLPVANPREPDRPLGYLIHSDLLEGRRRRMFYEHGPAAEPAGVEARRAG